MNMTDVFKRAVREIKVSFIPGSYFYLNEGQGHDTLRLNFTGTAFENIDLGIERLGKLLKEELKKQ